MLTQRLDPRGFKVWPIRAARTYEKNRPWLWRFWLKLPKRGQIAIFDRSWYGRVLVERVEEPDTRDEWRKAYRDIVDFERMLADDGHLIIKFWLHISRKSSAALQAPVEKDPLQSWHVQPEDWEHHRLYDAIPEGRRGDARAHRERVGTLDHRGGNESILHLVEGVHHHR